MTSLYEKLHESKLLHNSPQPPSKPLPQHEHLHHHHHHHELGAPTAKSMADRRSLLVTLIGLTLCVSIWQFSTQEPQLIVIQQSPPQPSAPVDDSLLTAAAAFVDPTTLPPPPLLPPNDATQLINLTDFAFTIDQPPCSGATDVLIIVHSAPANRDKRQTIRETWATGLTGQTGNGTARMRLFFLLGAVPTASDQQLLVDENRLHADLVQGNFADTYRNLTYKHVAALKWFNHRCPTGRFLVKADDDVFVHAPHADALLHDVGTSAAGLLLCSRVRSVRISRSYRNKWRVSPLELAGRYYPDFCPGFTVVYSADVVHQLYAHAQRLPFFWIDDVHVTGTLALAAGVTIQPFGRWFLTYDQQEAVLRQDERGPPSEANRRAWQEFVFTIPNLAADRIEQLWRAVTNGTFGEVAKLEEAVTTLQQTAEAVS